MGAMRRLSTVWLGQLRSKGIQYLLLIFLTVMVSISFYGARITESYIFNTWRESAQYSDVIIGYKGSPLQIVASTLFRIENPTGNIDTTTTSYWRKHPMVASSCAVSLGDNIQGFPLVGVDSNYFHWMDMTLLEGRFPLKDDDIVVDRRLAQSLQLNIGDELHSSHGSSTEGEKHDHHHLHITGIVDASRLADQQAFFTTTGAYYDMHEGKGVGNVTALMLRLKSKSALVMLPRIFDSRSNEQGAFPVFIFAQLEKQWAPTLAKLKKYSVIVPIVLLLMFTLVVAYLNGTEKEAKRFYSIQKLSVLEVFWLQHGLVLLAAAVGSVVSILLLTNSNLPYIHNEQGAILLPLSVVLVLGIYHSRRS